MRMSLSYVLAWHLILLVMWERWGGGCQNWSQLEVWRLENSRPWKPHMSHQKLCVRAGGGRESLYTAMLFATPSAFVAKTMAYAQWPKIFGLLPAEMYYPIIFPHGDTLMGQAEPSIRVLIFAFTITDSGSWLGYLWHPDFILLPPLSLSATIPCPTCLLAKWQDP